jgi:hypothetical protein
MICTRRRLPDVSRAARAGGEGDVVGAALLHIMSPSSLSANGSIVDAIVHSLAKSIPSKPKITPASLPDADLPQETPPIRQRLTNWVPPSMLPSPPPLPLPMHLDHVKVIPSPYVSSCSIELICLLSQCLSSHPGFSQEIQVQIPHLSQPIYFFALLFPSSPFSSVPLASSRRLQRSSPPPFSGERFARPLFSRRAFFWLVVSPCHPPFRLCLTSPVTGCDYC